MGGWGGRGASARTRSMDMGIARAARPFMLTMLAMLGSLEGVRTGRGGGSRDVTGLEGNADDDGASGAELASESESWLSGSGGVELGLRSTVV